jgi:hypothetical protein
MEVDEQPFRNIIEYWDIIPAKITTMPFETNSPTE